MDIDVSKFFNTCLLFVATIVVAKLISAFIVPKSRKRLPPIVKGLPFIGGLPRFLKGPIFMLREEYPNWAPESELSQQEVYQFNVPTFGPGVVFDVDYSVRQEQFRFFTEALRVNKLKSYVDQMVTEAQDYFSKWGESGEVDLKYELEHLIILTASRCL
ncbi:Sterol 14-demethylase [Arachis hypogaea]|nr:Sterol 14-demethylase [Arachis hypogaea]